MVSGLIIVALVLILIAAFCVGFSTENQLDKAKVDLADARRRIRDLVDDNLQLGCKANERNRRHGDEIAALRDMVDLITKERDAARKVANDIANGVLNVCDRNNQPWSIRVHE